MSDVRPPAASAPAGTFDIVTVGIIAAVFGILFVVWFVGIGMSTVYKIRDANVSRHSTRYDAGGRGDRSGGQA